MSEILVLQHIHCETLGIIEQVLVRYGLTPRYIEIFAGEPVPRRMGHAAGLVVLGGPMSVYEQSRHPHLVDEMHLIDRAVKDETPILGICLGSQLLAAVLGAQVRRAERQEIGWHPVTMGELAGADALFSPVLEEAGEPAFTAFHWHGDAFALPAGAESLASSQTTAHQAFVYGRNAYGILFHMEVTEKIIGEMVSAFSHELDKGGIGGDEILAGIPEHLTQLNHIGRAVFQVWAAEALAWSSQG